jgi:hypothetical protein
MAFDSIESFEVVMEDSPISKSYGQKETSKVIVVTFYNIDKTGLTTRIWVKKD